MEDDGSKLWLSECEGSDADLRIPVGLDEGPIGMSELVSNTGLLPTFFADKLSGPIKSCNFLRGSHPTSFLLSGGLALNKDEPERRLSGCLSCC